jgi:hypothetical protein
MFQNQSLILKGYSLLSNYSDYYVPQYAVIDT